MGDLISRESLKQRINLNYNNHQFIDAQSMKDIINTEPTVEDNTIEELEKIMIEIGNITETKIYCGNVVFKNPQEIKNEVMEILDNHISELKGSDLMTDKEAIEILKLYCKRLTDSVSNQLDKDIEAFDMAIKSLENKTEELEKIKGEIYNKCPCTSVRETTLYILDKHISELKRRK